MFSWLCWVLCALLGTWSAGLRLAGAEVGTTPRDLTAVPTALVYHPDYLLHDPGPSHPERPERLQVIMAHLEQQGLLDQLLPAPAAASRGAVDYAGA